MPGMSLRDYFAAKAMQAMISNSAMYDSLPTNKTCMAMEAYEVADAMLEARK